MTYNQSQWWPRSGPAYPGDPGMVFRQRAEPHGYPGMPYGEHSNVRPGEFALSEHRAAEEFTRYILLEGGVSIIEVQRLCIGILLADDFSDLDALILRLQVAVYVGGNLKTLLNGSLSGFVEDANEVRGYLNGLLITNRAPRLVKWDVDCIIRLAKAHGQIEEYRRVKFGDGVKEALRTLQEIFIHTAKLANNPNISDLLQCLHPIVVESNPWLFRRDRVALWDPTLVFSALPESYAHDGPNLKAMLMGLTNIDGSEIYHGNLIHILKRSVNMSPYQNGMGYGR